MSRNKNNAGATGAKYSERKSSLASFVSVDSSSAFIGKVEDKVMDSANATAVADEIKANLSSPSELPVKSPILFSALQQSTSPIISPILVKSGLKASEANHTGQYLLEKMLNQLQTTAREQNELSSYMGPIGEYSEHRWLPTDISSNGFPTIPTKSIRAALSSWDSSFAGLSEYDFFLNSLERNNSVAAFGVMDSIRSLLDTEERLREVQSLIARQKQYLALQSQILPDERTAVTYPVATLDSFTDMENRSVWDRKRTLQYPQGSILSIPSSTEEQSPPPRKRRRRKRQKLFRQEEDGSQAIATPSMMKLMEQEDEANDAA